MAPLNQQLYLPDLCALENQAAEAAATGAYVEAIDAFKRVLTADPERSTAHEMLSQCYLEIGNDCCALTSVKHALRLDPENPHYHITHARVLFNSKKLQPAVDAFKLALTFDPSSEEAAEELQEAEALLRQSEVDTREVVLNSFSGKRVLVRQRPGDEAGPATVIWEAGAVLANYLAQCVVENHTTDHPQLATGMATEIRCLLLGHRVLELGAGTGVVGLTAAALGAYVCLTDREPASLELAQQNAALNRSIIEEAQGTIEVAKLNWASCQENPLCALPWELVVGADLVYHEQQIGPLRNAIQALFNGGRDVRMLIAHKHRHTALDEGLMEMFEHLQLEVDEIPLGQHHPEFRTTSVSIYMLRSTARSSSNLPSNNDEP
ncbi:hypothetical protein CYMTET_26716 [Cymbomonas tetramitiformis]|uniref:Uncharacterized protein n=1 Tax=Cymbomonas tetramitiformis TaxID=36881 RepID=A0AAE0FRZ8_9CHLO|nr:hypothetical protein CYMTET_26716 [Cymbomonas tetramitiformis]